MSRVEILTWTMFKPGDVIVENPAVPGGTIVVERPAPRFWRGQVGTAESSPGISRRRVFHNAGVVIEGETYTWVDEHGNLLKDDEIVDFQPEPTPDLAAAVDAYARHIQRIREAVEDATMSNAARANLLALVDAAPVKP
jgi:hypothetical protein